MSFPDFPTFFKALWPEKGHDPFPWQTMLAERAAANGWPDAIDLPTASGKTACLDIAVWVLAKQADNEKRSTPRRIWFVVDRRIVVDEAYDRAEKIAASLEGSTSPAIRAVADRLLGLRGLDSKKRPLAVGRLRGGVLRDDRWARIPSQAAIITSTVDQLGSRLLFRGYGHGDLSASIFAGLAANDSLVLLDEAHCARPFMQTLRAVQFFRSAKWSEVANPAPFHATILSATPPEDDDAEKARVFPADDAEREKALAHPVLQARLTTLKRAVLHSVGSEDALTRELAEAAERFAREGVVRIGVIVNRVARATEIARLLREAVRKKLAPDEPPAFDVELLTGRIRAVERDLLVGEKLSPLLHSSPKAEPPRPLILVSTQCLEVGADFSFDALVTECASLDALRQRFGRLARLARLGQPADARAAIFVAAPALKESDPIYGDALRKTWEFLWSKAAVATGAKGGETRTVDFGFETLRAMLPPPEELRDLLAPAPDAPILLPAHLDLLCQTAPRPHPDPDIAIFLHGKERGSPEVRVLFRCDLDPARTGDWPEIVSLCRPVAGEMFSVPLHRLRAWLLASGDADTTGDVQGERNDSDDGARGRTPPFLIWRGREKSTIHRDAGELFPDSIVVLPAPEDAVAVARIDALGQTLRERGLGPQRLDVWEWAVQSAGQPAALRVTRRCLAQWTACAPLADLLALVESEAADLRAELRDALAALREWKPEDEAPHPLPAWLRARFDAVEDFQFADIATHPGGGIIIRGKRGPALHEETDFFADEDDERSAVPQEVALENHCRQVAHAAGLLARACLGEVAVPLATLAGRWHDAGKLDPRFQSILRGGASSEDTKPLAKSPDKPRSREREREIAEAAGLPRAFRHEMLSLALVERFLSAEIDPADRDLFLHLIASHHGHARPFAPVCEDAAPPALDAIFAEKPLALSAAERAALTPPHRLDSGVADRFWLLTRRFGWWGLAHREAILRLADWYVSAHPKDSPP